MSDPLQRCGPFVLGPQLARSDHAELYLARTEADSEYCYVVKLLRQTGAEGVQRLRDRIERLAAAPPGPALVVPIQASEVQGQPYLVRAAPPAVDLTQLLAELKQRKVDLGFEVALAVVLDVLAALAGLHARLDAAGMPMLHGAVDASHVLISETGDALLIGAEQLRAEGAAARRLDVAGAVALLYEVLGAGASRPLPAAQEAQQRALRARFEPIVVRGLGMAGDDPVASSAATLAELLREELAAAGGRVDHGVLAELVHRLGRAQPPACPPARTASAPLGAGRVALPAPIDFGALPGEPAPPVAPQPPHDDPQRALSEQLFGASSPKTIDDAAEITAPHRRPSAPPPATEPMLPVVRVLAPPPPDAPVLPSPPARDAAASARAEETAPTPAVKPTPPAARLAAVPLKRVVVVRDKAQAGPAPSAATPTAAAPPGTPLREPGPRAAAPGGPPRDQIEPARRRLGEILVGMGAIEVTSLDAALALQPQQGGRLGEILGRMGVLGDEPLAAALACQSALPLIGADELRLQQVPLRLLNALPEAYASAKRILPLSHDPAARSVTLAVVDPYDRATVNEARILLAAPQVDVRVAPRGPLEEAIRRVYASRGVETVGEGGALLLLATANQGLADTLKARLVAEGFSVRHVADGQLARDALEQGGVHGVVCELSLPKVDGYNLLLSARSRDASRDLPIFVFSSRADDYHMSKALELGADDFLPMPLNLDFLVSKLRRSVVKRPSPEASSALAPPAGGVAGALAEMSLTEIVQTLELGRKTASVAIQCADGVSGVIGFVGGQVTFAKAGDKVGEPAFYALAVPRDGNFQIRYGETQAEKNIDNSTTFLLLEAMRRTDERR